MLHSNSMELLQPQSTNPFADRLNSKAFLGTEGIYMLPHHEQEINRLQRQHRFMKGTTDGTLLATPLPPKESTLRVLDSGCADGLSFLVCSPLLIVVFHGDPALRWLKKWLGR